MADLSVNLCGISLPNPFVLASGPLTWNAEAIQAAFAAAMTFGMRVPCALTAIVPPQNAVAMTSGSIASRRLEKW